LIDDKFDIFTKIAFVYPHAVASLKVGKGVKSEGELIVSGTKGYIYVPSPWWKTDYFEVRYENPANNKRYFYQLDGEGIRYEIVSFLKAVETKKTSTYIEQEWSKGDLLSVLGVYDNTDICLSNQLWGGAFIIRKSFTSCQMISEWIKVNKREKELVTDKKSEVPNKKGLKNTDMIKVHSQFW
jgi:hypothetical protein